MAKGASGFNSGKQGPKGRAMSMKRFLENLSRNSREGMLQALASANLEVKKAVFTENGNAIRSQDAILESGENKTSIRFFNFYDPRQVGKPSSAITTGIEIVQYKNGNATAIRTLEEKKSKSLKNAKKNYEEMLERWKRLTKQKSIGF